MNIVIVEWMFSFISFTSDGDVLWQGDLRSSDRGFSLHGFIVGINLTVHFYSFYIEMGISLDPSAAGRDKVFDAVNMEKELYGSRKTLEVVWLE